MSRRKPRGRPVNGILLLDKPVGASSNAALQQVKRLYGARKAGHTGSLDPLASGLLPICFGEATKVSAYLLDADKHYLVRARLGIKTATGDAEGEVIARTDADMPARAALARAAQNMLGEQQQIPPMYSAVKHQGRRLYELAREGKTVPREPRPIRIDEFSLLALEDSLADFRVRCSKGTYVRTLIEDLAESLGSLAHVEGLRRLGVGPFNESGMHDMAQLDALATRGNDALDAALLPIADALDHWPTVKLASDTAFYFRRGEPVQVAGAPTDGYVRVMDADARLLAVGEILDDGRIAPRRMLDRA